nr:MAG TPA: hypothetical protein [Caudoviricetes sp.]
MPFLAGAGVKEQSTTQARTAERCRTGERRSKWKIREPNGA